MKNPVLDFDNTSHFLKKAQNTKQVASQIGIYSIWSIYTYVVKTS